MALGGKVQNTARPDEVRNLLPGPIVQRPRGSCNVGDALEQCSGAGPVMEGFILGGMR